MTRPDGLQAERTRLAWERTALAVLTGAALLLLQHARNADGLAPAVCGVVLALGCAALGAHRSRRIRSGAAVAPRTILAAGVAIVVWGTAVTVALVLA